MRTTTAILFLALAFGGCAHTPAPVRACVDQLTADVTQTAMAALAGANYEAVIERKLGSLAACLVIAAVEAAVAQARTMKLAGDPAELAAIARNGDAWLAVHRT